MQRIAIGKPGGYSKLELIDEPAPRPVESVPLSQSVEPQHRSEPGQTIGKLALIPGPGDPTCET